MSAPTKQTTNGVPSWLAAAGIKEGEFLIMSKPELQTMQRPCHLLTVQVWATGMLHTAGYQGQLAVIMRKGKITQNLASMDISEELHGVAVEYYRGAGVDLKHNTPEWDGLRESRQHIRRALEELEEAGVCERRDFKGRPLRDLSLSELHRLPSGSGQLHFWARPRRAKPENVQREWDERVERLKPRPENGDVAATWLPTSSIQLILKAVASTIPAIFTSGTKLTRAEIEDPAYQRRFENAWKIAAKSFADAWEGEQVAATQLPLASGPANRPTATSGSRPTAPLYKEERQGKDNTGKTAAAATDSSPKSVGQSPGPTDSPSQLQTAAKAIAKTLQTELGARCAGETPGSKLCAQIHIGLRGAPLSWLIERIRKRLDRITSMGMALELAREAGKAWESGAKLRTDAKNLTQEAHNFADRHADEYLRSVLESNAPEEEKQFARRYLGIDSKGVGGS